MTELSPSQLNPRWYRHAACLGMPTELFFPPRKRGYDNSEDLRRARAVCRICPVREECFDDVVLEKSPAVGLGVTGVRAGMTGRTLRRAVYAERRARLEREAGQG